MLIYQLSSANSPSDYQARTVRAQTICKFLNFKFGKDYSFSFFQDANKVFTITIDTDYVPDRIVEGMQYFAMGVNAVLNGVRT